MLDPPYVNKLTDIRDLNEVETVDTRTIINEMMPNFYDCIVAAELAENTYTESPSVTTNNRFLYFSAETVGYKRTASRGGINILRDRIQS